MTQRERQPLSFQSKQSKQQKINDFMIVFFFFFYKINFSKMSFVPADYESYFRIDGKPILPPLVIILLRLNFLVFVLLRTKMLIVDFR